MKTFFKVMLMLALVGGVATSTTGCRNAGKAAKEISKKMKGKGSNGKALRFPKTCSKCGHTYTGFDCPYC